MQSRKKIDNQLRDLKCEAKQIRRSLLNFYLNGLRNTSLTKPEGLSGIIKDLLNLNVTIQKLSIDNFPYFFDSKMVDFIIKVTT